MAKKSTRLEALHDIFEENGISPDTIELNDSLIQDIKKHAEMVPDYRHPSYTKHLLGDIIMIVFFARRHKDGRYTAPLGIKTASAEIAEVPAEE